MIEKVNNPPSPRTVCSSEQATARTQECRGDSPGKRTASRTSAGVGQFEERGEDEPTGDEGIKFGLVFLLLYHDRLLSVYVDDLGLARRLLNHAVDDNDIVVVVIVVRHVRLLLLLLWILLWIVRHGRLLRLLVVSHRRLLRVVRRRRLLLLWVVCRRRGLLWVVRHRRRLLWLLVIHHGLLLLRL